MLLRSIDMYDEEPILYYIFENNKNSKKRKTKIKIFYI